VDKADHGLIARTRLLMAVLGAGGLAASTALQGKPGGFGFLTGAAASAVSFWLLHRLTGTLEAAAGGESVSPLRMVLLSVRFLVVGAGVYVILKKYEVSPSAVAAGLCLTVAAVTLANLYDWFRT
jgi:hypothetical protein